MPFPPITCSHANMCTLHTSQHYRTDGTHRNTQVKSEEKQATDVRHISTRMRYINYMRLTQRERDVLKLLCTGFSNKEIAEQLILEPSTIKTHIASCRKKLGALNRTHLAVQAIRLGIIT